MRKLTRLGVLVLGVLGVGAPAATAVPATIHKSPGSVQRGHAVRVFGRVPGCAGPVTLISGAFSHRRDFAGRPAISAHVSGAGYYTIVAHIPATRAPGAYTISGRCGGGNIGTTAVLRVLR